jgi:hypothetical protein
MMGASRYGCRVTQCQLLVHAFVADRERLRQGRLQLLRRRNMSPHLTSLQFICSNTFYALHDADELVPACS